MWDASLLKRTVRILIAGVRTEMAEAVPVARLDWDGWMDGLEGAVAGQGCAKGTEVRG